MLKRRVESVLVAAIVFLCFLTLSGCASPGDGEFRAVGDANAQPQGDSDPPKTADYQIATGDTLEVVVYQVQDFNRVAQVDAAGNIALPLLGAIPAAGLTVHDVEADITKRLKAKYLQNPQVSVTDKDPVGLRVTVQGAVKNPGVIPLRGNVTLTQMVAQAQGFTETADNSNVLIIRKTDQGRVAAKVNAGAILAGTAPDPVLRGGDTIVVADSVIRSRFKDAMTILEGAAAVKFLVPTP